MRAWFEIAIQRSIRQRALKVAAIVGSILIIINQGDVLLLGNATPTTWIQIMLTFLVPYCVSTFASVQAIRHLSATVASTDAAANDTGKTDAPTRS